jgi:hypothetical protein
MPVVGPTGHSCCHWPQSLPYDGGSYKPENLTAISDVVGGQLGEHGFFRHKCLLLTELGAIRWCATWACSL